MNALRYGCLTLLLLALGALQARPRGGLVLSGGGAKGIVHVGVLRWLEEHRVAVDYIAGTSIGSYVGALHALGYSAEEIKTIMLGINWNKGYSDQVPRYALDLFDKHHRDQYNIPIDLGFQAGNVVFPEGWLQGQSMLEIIHESVGYLPLLKV